METAYFQYLAAKALREAQEVSVREAETNLQAAEDRHHAGVATIADVLQAKTLLAQSRLDLQTVVGRMQATRGSLAAALGYPANLPVEVGELPAELPIEAGAEAIDALLERAVRERPDLAAARARAEAADRKAERIRAEGRPRLDLAGRVNRTYFEIAGSEPANNYSLRLLLTYPLFTGFARRHDVEQAEADADTARARADDLRQQVLVEVWQSYAGLETAAQNVGTSGELVASAGQSQEVAAGRYQAGAGSILDLLTAQAVLATARAEQIQARADWLLAVAQLARDTGRLGALPPEKGSHAPDAHP